MALWLRDHGVAVSVAVAVVSTLLGIAVGLGGYHLPWLSRTLFALAAVGVVVLIVLMRRPAQGRDLEARFADEEFGGKDLFFPAGSDRDGTAGCSVVLDLGFVLTNASALPVTIIGVEVRLLGAALHAPSARRVRQDVLCKLLKNRDLFYPLRAGLCQAPPRRCLRGMFEMLALESSTDAGR